MPTTHYNHCKMRFWVFADPSAVKFNAETDRFDHSESSEGLDMVCLTFGRPQKGNESPQPPSDHCKTNVSALIFFNASFKGHAKVSSRPLGLSGGPFLGCFDRSQARERALPTLHHYPNFRIKPLQAKVLS